MKSRKIGMLVLAAAILLLALPAAAQIPEPEPEPQAQTGDLICKTIDTAGHQLAGVTVSLAGIGPPQIQLSSAEGQVRFLGLAPGTYQLEADLEGFAKVEYPTVTIIAGRPTEIEIVMKPAETRPPV
jgi:hypothetical protein